MKKDERKIKKLPSSPGVYFFLGKRKKILYIGKATVLRDRVRSYFTTDISSSRGPLIEKMLEEARDVSFQKTDSVLEAVILEAALIKKHVPKYNVRDKDNKSFNYVIITDEDFPRVLLIRGRELSKNKIINRKSKIVNLKFIFGPFPQAGILKEALSLVRKIFPYRDRCTPCLLKTKKCKPCFNRQIKLCPGICSGEMSKTEYRKNIRNITLFFEGKKKKLIETLTREMKAAARKEEFEKAKELRTTLFALKHIQDVSLLKSNMYEVNTSRSSGGLNRIEAYDVAHMAGEKAVGVFSVVNRGEIDKSEYRKFIIRESEGGGDVPSLKEILTRRLTHSEWDMPDLIVVDGGKAQINATVRILKKEGRVIPVVGVVKDEYHRPKRIEGDKVIIKQYEREILLANHEAHRFAITYHRKKMRNRL